MRARRRVQRDDRGTVLVLAAGFVVVVLLAVVVLVAASAGFLPRRALVALADAAALAGAQSIDIDTYYREGATAATTLDARLVPGRVRAHLARFGGDLPPGMVVEEVESAGDRVRVALSAPLRLPFAGEALGVRIVVVSEAELAYRESA